MDINALAKQFTEHYYSVFDTKGGRGGLVSLYRPNSMLSYEDKQFVGADAIVSHLVGLPFEEVQHKIDTLDAQPSSPTERSLLIKVTGRLLVGGEQMSLSFTQTFNLQTEGETYYVFNDMFRLVYG